MQQFYHHQPIHQHPELMESIKKTSESLDNFTNEELSELIKSNDALDQEQSRIIEEEIEEEKRRREARKPFKKLKKSPLELINRPLLFIFIGSFIVSFILIYNQNRIWFFVYLVSAFSCIMYTPNRKALKEILDAWPNTKDLIRGQSLWRK